MDKDKYSQGLSPEDLRLLKDMMKDVDPLDGKFVDAPSVETGEEIEEEAPFRVIPSFEKFPAKPRNTEGSGLDKRTDEKLRRGQMPIEARLDMHGLTQDQAYTALGNFILSSYERGYRCVLLITGKGKSKSSEQDWLAPQAGILKTRTPEWLNEKSLKPLILKTYPARPKDGGEGALYVLLRRKRD